MLWRFVSVQCVLAVLATVFIHPSSAQENEKQRSAPGLLERVKAILPPTVPFGSPAEMGCGALGSFASRLSLQRKPPVHVCFITSAATKPRIFSLHVFSDIKFHFATTLVTSRVLNPSQEAREAVFDVTLPNQAFIANFTLEIGGKVYPGAVKEKAEAQKQYDKAKKKGQSAGQVTQRPRETNSFKVEINVAALEKVTFNLTYQEVLERRLGVYEHVVYIDPGQLVEDMSVEVAIEENREITYLHVPPIRNDLLTDVDLTAPQSDAQISRPAINRAVIRYTPSREEQLAASSTGISGLFTVRYDVSRNLDGGDLLVVNGYFVHFFAPAVEEPVPKDVLFILDTSTSMTGDKLQQLKDAMRVVLEDMTEGDRFVLMEFNSGATVWSPGLVPVTRRNIARAINYVDNLDATGWTNIDKALSDGLKLLIGEGGSGDSSIVIFLTDGEATKGEDNPDAILKNALKRNKKEMPIYSLAFGENADWTLVKKLASQNNGVARRIYEDSDSALQIQGFYKEVSTMLLTGVQAKYLDGTVDVESLTQSSFKNYFNGSEIIIAGKLLDNSLRSLSVTMEAKDKDGDLNLSLTSGALDLGSVTASDLMDVDELAQITEKMWAYLTLKQILKQQVGETDPKKKEELKAKAVDLSLKYNFVTPVTSMVVTKPDEEDLGDLQEDASDLKDDSGGGDPHFMMEMKSLRYPLCFDVDGPAGQVFQLLRDPDTGLTVNVELGEGLKTREHKENGGHRIYIYRAAIMLQDIVMEISRQQVWVNGQVLQWNVTQSQRMPGVWVMMTEGGTMRFVLDSGVEVEITKHVHPTANPLGADFLNVEVENEDRLSLRADGLLGQFVHKKITLRRMKINKQNKMVAFLRSRSGKVIQHGQAYLIQRKDPFFNRTTPCLTLRSKGARILDHPTDYYKVRDLFYV
ncbi:hypothetical protein BaRGS_00018212 [Batillaria attramentaria]|uniref:Uncharacterized protein n=1 Tax=Batillaria attramentaria TaxID=370345 RepID=A0ABD0KTP6_9CAEN